jgi:hypothetical protein
MEKRNKPVILSEAKDLALSPSNLIGGSFVVRFPSRSVVNFDHADTLKLRARSCASLRMTGSLCFSATRLSPPFGDFEREEMMLENEKSSGVGPQEGALSK